MSTEEEIIRQEAQRMFNLFGTYGFSEHKIVKFMADHITAIRWQFDPEYMCYYCPFCDSTVKAGFKIEPPEEHLDDCVVHVADYVLKYWRD